MSPDLAARARRRILPWLAAHNPGDITIRNPHTRDRLRLHSFRHKGYWFHRRRREAPTMALFARLVHPGDRVAEVGGHIGFITQYFAHLVGPSGSVVVFEPGPNNLPYLRSNVARLSHVTIVEEGVGHEPGRATFYVEGLTGQNNSFVPHFEGLEVNARAAGVEPNVQAVEVSVTTLDAHFDEPPDFVKVDVEGFELEVLLGARRMLETGHPALMVEVQTHQAELRALADELGYVVLDEHGAPNELPATWAGNSFWLHPARHRGVIDELRRRHA
jgi:FkbM family methyltransferase